MKDANKKTKKPQDKQKKFDKILEKIDNNLDDMPKDPKMQIHQYMSKQNEWQQQDQDNDFTQNIGINDFLKKLDENQHYNQNEEIIQEQIDNQDGNQQLLKKQIEDMQKNTLLAEPESLAKQEQDERKANYSIIKKDMQKWIPIIKRNREAEHLNFTNKDQVDNLRVNAVMGNDLSHPIAQQIESSLKKNEMESETALKKKEKALNKDQINQLKDKNLLFFKELKHKRVSKIKSKMYHKIKNKKKQKEMAANGETGMNLQQLEEEQVKERIQQRHKTKGKNLRNLLKYGDKKSVQQTVTANAEMRKQILQKILQLDGQDADDFDFDDENAFREKAIKELEKELNDNIDDNKKTGLGFIDKHNEKQNSQAIEEAKKLLEKLKQNDDLEELFSEDEVAQMEEEEDEDEENKNKKKNKKDSKENKEEEFEGRKVYKPEKDDKKKGEFVMDLEDDDNNNRKNKGRKQDAGKILKSYLKDQEEGEGDDIQQQEVEQQQQQKDKKEQLLTNDNKKLTEDFNINQLQDKYKKSMKTVEFNEKDLELFDIENKEHIYKNLENFNILVDDENEKEFMKDKYDDYEGDIKEEPKKLQGWGSWAGQGIAKKPEPSQEEKMAKKRKLIEQMKRQREDGELDNVIKREKRNKLVTQYFVKELPHQYQNADQFNFMTNQAVGREWNTLKSTQKLAQPRIVTKVGQKIQPIKAPKRSKNN